ncbi:MAG TPA: hypothetical protein VF244_01565 [Acidimicrobiales bacterium]
MPIATNKTNATLSLSDHPPHHNALATAVNDLVAGIRPSNYQTANYVLVLDDAGKAIDFDKATAGTVTVPPNASVALPLNATILVAQIGVGTVSLVAGAGVTLSGPTSTTGQYTGLLLRQRATNTWFASHVGGAIVQATPAAGQAITQGDSSPGTGQPALTIVTTSGPKPGLHIFDPNTGGTDVEDALLTLDWAGSAFPGPLVTITSQGVIHTGGALVVSGHPQNAGPSSLYQPGTLLRTMVGIWNDFIPAAAADSTCVLTLRNNGAAYPAGDGGNCNVIHIVEDTSSGDAAPGNTRLAIRPKGDIYTHFTAHSSNTDALLATNYERAYQGWDAPNSRYVVETQAGGTGTRRELLVKDRKFVAAGATGSVAASLTLMWWAVPRDLKVKAVRFVNETALGVSGSNFWRVRVLRYVAGNYSSDIVDYGSDSAAFSTDTVFTTTTPATTTVVAGNVLRIAVDKIGSPAALVTPSIVVEWEPV